MSRDSETVRKNLIPASIATTLEEAFEEWSFTEETRDHENAVAECELCEKEQLRYHFEIENKFNSNRMWVGSKCILRFSLAVFENGQRLSPALARRKLARLQRQMQQASCIRGLENLAVAEDNPILRNALDYYKRNGNLTPKFAFVVFWKLETHDIDHRKSFFRISLRRDQHKDDLRKMAPDRIKRIWPALTKSQKRTAISLGVSPPEK